MKKALPKTLVLDYKKWICGNPNENENKNNCHGSGDTQLLNNLNYQCCLGQFCMQAGCTRKEIKNFASPAGLNEVITGLTAKIGGSTRNTLISEQAVNINDNRYTTIAQKVVRLRRLFSKRGYKIQLKNFPKTVLDQLGVK